MNLYEFFSGEEGAPEIIQVSRVTVLFISTSSIVNWMFFSSFTGAFFSELDCFCNEILGHRSVLCLFP